MFFTNSLLIVQVDNLDIDNSLHDYYSFERNNEATDSRKFYSINFHNKLKTIGEIHYTSSFENGDMNLLNFFREDNIFFLFTSSVQHIKFFKKIIRSLESKADVSFKTIKIPVSNSLLPKYSIDNFKVIEADGVFGVKGLLTFNNINHLVKIYNNGVVMFPFTNDKELVEEVIQASLKLIKKYE